MTGDYEERLALLKKKFVASIAGRLDTLDAAVAERDVAAARREAHNLKGTAASFEVMEVVEPMRAIEALLDAHLGAGTEPSSGQWEALRRHIGEAREAV